MPNDSVRDLVRQIVLQIPTGSELTVRRVTNAPRVQRRVQGAARSEQLIVRAREVRAEDGTPFWHALFDIGEREHGGVPIEIVRSALFHQDPLTDPSVTFEVDDNVSDRLAEMASRIEGPRSLSIDSRVRLPDGETAFIPMLDFSVKSDRVGGAATASACLEALAEPGLLVSSGRSFHFYGRRLLTSEDQIKFWAKSLLLTPIVDERWIAHQMLGGRAALRISANERGYVPRVIWELRDVV